VDHHLKVLQQNKTYDQMKNYHDSIALVAAAIMILAGSIAIGAGAIAEALPEHRGLQLGEFAEGAGKALLIGGCSFFVWVFCKYLSGQKRD
tara:strand:+ start:528 stop:800 length:273 start_codon:yes stop_codon:yes gene_type:complete